MAATPTNNNILTQLRGATNHYPNVVKTVFTHQFANRVKKSIGSDFIELGKTEFKEALLHALNDPKFLDATLRRPIENPIIGVLLPAVKKYFYDNGVVLIDGADEPSWREYVLDERPRNPESYYFVLSSELMKDKYSLQFYVRDVGLVNVPYKHNTPFGMGNDIIRSRNLMLDSVVNLFMLEIRNELIVGIAEHGFVGFTIQIDYTTALHKVRSSKHASEAFTAKNDYPDALTEQISIYLTNKFHEHLPEMTISHNENIMTLIIDDSVIGLLQE